MWNRLSYTYFNIFSQCKLFLSFFTNISVSEWHNPMSKPWERWSVFHGRLWGEIQYKIDFHFFSVFFLPENRNPPQQQISPAKSFVFLSIPPFLFPFCHSFFVYLPFLFPWFLKYSSDWFLCLFAQVLNVKSQIAKMKR